MSLDQCLESVEKASKGRITKDRAKELLADIEREIQENGTSYGEVLETLEEAKKVNADQRLLKKYNAYQNALNVKKVADGLSGENIGAFKSSYRNLITRLEEARNVQQAEIKSALTRDLKNANVLEAFRKQEDPELVTKFMHELSQANAENINIKNLPAEQHDAFRIAEALTAHNKRLRKLQNSRGLAVSQLEGRIARNYWSSDKLHYATKDSFIKDMSEAVDWGKTDTKGLTIEEYLTEKYENFTSGNFGKAEDDIVLQDLTKGGVREQFQSSMLAKRGKKRSLHIKPEAHHQIMTKYGYGDIYATIKREAEEVGRDLAMLRELGSQPEAVLKSGIDQFKARTKNLLTEGERHFADDSIVESGIDGLFGRSEIPANKMAARIGNSWRKFISVDKLGNVVLTSLADLATPGFRSAMMVNGSNNARQVATVAESLATQFKQMIGIYGDKTAKRMWKVALEELDDLAFDALGQARYSDLMSVDDVAGRLNHNAVYKTLNFVDKTHDNMFKLVGLDKYTEQRIANVYPSIGRDFALMAEQGTLGKFDREFLKELQLEDIWDLMKTKVYKDPETNKGYMLVEAFDDLTDADIASLPDAPKSEFGRQKLKAELRNRYRTAFAQESRKRIIMPGSLTKTRLTMGTKRGTFGGEFIRNMGQFKSFPVELYSELISPAVRNGQLGALGSWMASATGLFMIRNWVLDLVQGKTPRNMLFNPDEPTVFARNWSGVFAGVIGFPVLDQILPAYIGEGTTTKYDWLSLFGAGNAQVVSSIESTLQASKAFMEGETDKGISKAVKTVTKAPIIGPALHGNFFTKNVMGHWYNAFYAMFDPDYEDKLHQYAQQQGSRYYNLSRSDELGEFIDDVATPFED